MTIYNIKIQETTTHPISTVLVTDSKEEAFAEVDHWINQDAFDAYVIDQVTGKEITD